MIQGQFYGDAGFVFDVFFQTFQGIDQGGFGQAQVVADLVNLGDDFVGVLLAHADGVHDLAGGHGDFGGVDAVGAEHRAAAALGALVVIAVPLVQDLFGHVLGAHQFREVFAREGVIAAVDLAQQILTRHRHVERIGGALVVVALVGAGATLDAGIQEYLQSAVFAGQFAQLADGFLFPTIFQFGGKAQRLLELGFGYEGRGVRHRPVAHRRDVRGTVFAEFGYIEIGHRGFLIDCLESATNEHG